MGILRTDKISGLENPTAVTGSVVFDGTGDYLTTSSTDNFDASSGNWTIEAWCYFTTSAINNVLVTGRVSTTDRFYILWIGTTLYLGDGSTNTVTLTSQLSINQWFHIAVVKNSTTYTIYINGSSVGSTTDALGSYTLTEFQIGARTSQTWYSNGYISNLRVLKGTALYTANFTPPTHELEVIGDTVLLCCNNPDSAGAASYASIGTSKTITVNGDAAASTFSPGLTRDFTSGTEFKGVTTFDTQGYFVPPSGTTEQRGRGRGLFAAGDPGTTSINYITIASMGNAFEFGDLTEGRLGAGSAASSTRALFAGGFVSAANKDTIDFVTIATTGNAVSFGELVGTDRHEIGGASSSTRALFAGGSISASPNMSDEIDYVTIASLGDATDFGNLVLARRNTTGVMSPTRAVFCGGRNDTPSPSTQRGELDYVTIATTGNALDFGDLTVARGRMGSVCSSVRGVVGGGEGSPADSNVIDYITIASTGNAQDFGDMITASEGDTGGCSNSLRGVFGGHDVPGGKNTMEYVTISSTGNSQDFGDLLYSVSRKSGCSDSHGGIS